MKQIEQAINQTTAASLTGYLHEATAADHGKTWPAILIVPGGSYTHIPEAQSQTIARTLAARGFQAFVLRYSFVSERRPLLPTPVIEIAQTVALLKRQAVAWALNPQAINLLGFSAGGHLVALYNDWYSQPDFVALTQLSTATMQPRITILGYPLINPTLGFPKDPATVKDWSAHPSKLAADQQVTAANVPTFIWATTDDPVVPATNAVAYAQALMAAGVDTELHLFHHGPHGMTLATPATALKSDQHDPRVAQWLDLALSWLAESR